MAALCDAWSADTDGKDAAAIAALRAHRRPPRGLA
jgi:hypothetical protein